MIRSIINRFGTTLYVQVWENRLKVTDVETMVIFDEKPLLQVEDTGKKVKNIVTFGNSAKLGSLNPFSHPRTVFSDFYVAQRLLQEVIGKVLQKRFITPAPAIVIHPMEKTEGGLTMIEVRAFRELCLASGARDAVVFQGAQLNPHQVEFKKLAKQFNE